MESWAQGDIYNWELQRIFSELGIKKEDLNNILWDFEFNDQINNQNLFKILENRLKKMWIYIKYFRNWSSYIVHLSKNFAWGFNFASIYLHFDRLTDQDSKPSVRYFQRYDWWDKDITMIEKILVKLFSNNLEDNFTWKKPFHKLLIEWLWDGLVSDNL